jgi:hypothetical protein
MKIVVAESMTGKVLHSFAEAMPDFSRFSPQRDGLVSQQRAERILADRAIELGVGIRFHTEVESFAQNQDEVTVRLRDRGTGEPARISARYLVAADGHKGTLRDAAGIGVHGRQRGAAVTTMFASFDADLRPALDGAAVGLWHLRNAALPHGNATVFTTDDPGRFVIGGGFSAADAEPGRLIEHIRIATGVPDLKVRNLDVAWTSSNTWITRVADSFSAVLAGHAGDRLLDSHDAERRPYADQLAEQQYANYVQRIDPSLADESVAEIIDPARGLFGYTCPSGAFLPEPGHADGGLFEDPAHPTARPGARAPHAVLPDGSSTRDLFGRGFILLTAGRDSDWKQAAAGLIPQVSTHSLDDAARTRYALPTGGATLVRPDGVIAWRSADPAALAAALHDILH